MYGQVQSASTVTGAAGVAVLPHTGSFRVMFVVSAVTLAIGATALVVSGVLSLKRHMTQA